MVGAELKFHAAVNAFTYPSDRCDRLKLVVLLHHCTLPAPLAQTFLLCNRLLKTLVHAAAFSTVFTDLLSLDHKEWKGWKLFVNLDYVHFDDLHGNHRNPFPVSEGLEAGEPEVACLPDIEVESEALRHLI